VLLNPATETSQSSPAAGLGEPGLERAEGIDPVACRQHELIGVVSLLLENLPKLVCAAVEVQDSSHEHIITMRMQLTERHVNKDTSDMSLDRAAESKRLPTCSKHDRALRATDVA